MHPPESALSATASASADAALTSCQRRFFETFGFLRLPGLLQPQLPALREAFERLVGARPCTQLLERDEALTQLLLAGPLPPLLRALLGPSWQYLDSSGARIEGRAAPWHCDTFVRTHGFLRVLTYLEAHGPDAGALHVIPGSHRRELTGDLATDPGEAWDAQDRWGIPSSDVPSVALSVAPGDLICFDLNLLHANFGQGVPRRLMAITLASPLSDADQKETARMIAELALEHSQGHLLTPAFARQPPPALAPHLALAADLQHHVTAVAQGTAELRHPRLRRERAAALAAATR